MLSGSLGVCLCFLVPSMPLESVFDDLFIYLNQRFFCFHLRKDHHLLDGQNLIEMEKYFIDTEGK